jgi:hypothetical protein
MNLAVLVLDYVSYEFERGALDYYPRCRGCDRDSLPFEVEFVDPGDFGSIAFLYTETGDTLLFGTIVWAGTGGLIVPDDFLPAERFGELGVPAPDPADREYFVIYSPVDTAEFEARADTAWTHVRRLDIVWDFAAEDYQVGFYLYTPSVGVFAPTAARWIVFLYRS